MDSKKFLQMVEDKKKRILEKKEAPLKWQQKLEAAIKATEGKEKKLKSKKHKRRSYSSSESDSESESDGDRKHRIGRTTKGIESMATPTLMVPGGASAGQRGGAQTLVTRAIVMNTRVDLRKSVVGRSTHTRESTAGTLQGQTLMLQTSAVMTKSGGQARGTAIPGAAGAATGHQMTTLGRRAGRDTGSVIDQVMRTHLQILTVISATGAAPWGSPRMVEQLLANRTR